jgi:hypothetical protein
MATSQTCCHLPGELLNSAAECADRAQIRAYFIQIWYLSNHVDFRFCVYFLSKFVVPNKFRKSIFQCISVQNDVRFKCEFGHIHFDTFLETQCRSAHNFGKTFVAWPLATGARQSQYF